MFMDEYPVDEIVEVHQSVWKELNSLTPTLIYLYQDDIKKAMNRLYTLRSKNMIEKDLETTSQYKWFQTRRLKGIDGWVQFFREWQVVAERLYCDWPTLKPKSTILTMIGSKHIKRCIVSYKKAKYQPNPSCS